MGGPCRRELYDEGSILLYRRRDLDFESCICREQLLGKGLCVVLPVKALVNLCATGAPLARSCGKRV